MVLNDASAVGVEALDELHVFFGSDLTPFNLNAPEPQDTPLVPPVAKKKKDIARELGVSRTTLWRMSKRQETADQKKQK